MTTGRAVMAAVLAAGMSLGTVACGKGGKAPEKEHAEEGKGGHEGEGGHQEGVVKLTAEQVKSAGLGLAKAERRAEVGLLEATAQIEAAGDRQARVGSRIGGRVTAVRAGVGDKVGRGATLAIVDSPEMGRAKADYIAAVAGDRVALESAERERKLYERKISSEKDWQEAQAQAIRAGADKDAAENRLHALGTPDSELARVRREGHYSSTLAVPAPIAGVVVEQSVTLGQMVEPAETLFLIMDLSEVWILVDIYERDLSQVRSGQNVRVKVTALGTREFTGKVQSVGSVIETKTRTAKARVVLLNPAGELRPGMFASVVFEGSTAGPGKQAVFVPSAAVQRDGDKTLVFVQTGPTEFEAKEVVVGHESEGWLEIEKGIEAGETVVTNGSFVLKSELKKAELGEGDSH